MEVLEALPEVAMIAYDRYLDVVGSTIRAQSLHPIFRPGTNIARFAYLSGGADHELQDWEQKTDLIASALRASLAQHHEDGTFLDLVGELAAGSDAFAKSWAMNLGNPGRTIVIIRHPVAGELRLRQWQLPLGGDSEDTLVVWTGADEDSASKLAGLGDSGRERSG